MTREDATMMVTLREANVAHLIALRSNSQEPLDSVVLRLIRGAEGLAPRCLETPTHNGNCERANLPATGKYNAEVLGSRVSAPTLGRLFGAIVDLIAEIDASVLERLEQCRSRKRGYIAHLRSDIHPGRPDLPTLKTNSGWWVSANVGTDDIIRNLEALCRAGDLEFGTDIRFPTSSND